ncbi:aminoglycoside phosphotransferase family protein [Actinophytocola xanthii]|nr:aminoglycoside phosphotransferase family protein [Actinophytocola xanthii]
MRLGENALFHLPAEQLVVRIARNMDFWADAEKEVSVSRWLNGLGFLAAETHDVPQPIRVDNHPVTFWRFIEGRTGDRRDIGTLGSVLRRLHELPRPDEFALPVEDILSRVQPRIESAAVPDSDRSFLLRRFHELDEDVAALRFPLAPAPTHGDAHNENLMFRDGQPILIDFERFSWGQPEWDLAMTATEYLTAKWWSRDEYDQFCESYGYDITTWTDGFATLRAVHELKMTTWLMQNVSESEEIAEEYGVRMRTLRGEPSPGWRPF